MSYARHRPRGLLPGIVLWLALGVLILALLWLAVAISLARTLIDPTVALRVTWEQPAAVTAQPLDTPPEIPFGTVLVHEGESVRPGQTLVAFDTALLAARRDLIEARLLAARFERRCLLDGGQAPPLSAGKGPGIDPDVLDALDAARLRCRTMTENPASIAAAHRQTVAALTDRLRRLDTQLALTFRPGPTGAAEDAARAAIVITLDRARTETLRGIEQGRLARTLAEGMQHRSARLDVLAEEIERDIGLVHSLDALIRQPRLTSPRGGIVERVRALDPGTISAAPRTFAMIRPVEGGAERLVAHLPAGSSIVAALEQPVTVILQSEDGGPHRHAPARVSAIAPVRKGVPGAGRLLELELETLPDPSAPLPEPISASLLRPAQPLLRDLWHRARTLLPQRGETPGAATDPPAPDDPKRFGQDAPIRP